MLRKNKTRKGGRIGIMNPTWSGGGCGCSVKPMMQLPAGISLGPLTAGLKGGGCPCKAVPNLPIPMGDIQREGYRGGYRATKRNLKYLRKWKRGESIGFTMLSSLKSKGLIPRSNGTKRLGPKYRR